jgi:hypothetical protein
MPVLRKERRQAHRRRYLELPILQEDHRWRSLHRLVSAPALIAIAPAARIYDGTANDGIMLTSHRTPAAAATRSTIRRLREIAEV